MGDVQTHDILDMLETTRDSHDDMTFIDISSDLQEYTVTPWLLTQAGGLKVEAGGGTGHEQTLMYNNGGYSKWVDEFAERTGTIINHLKKMKVNYSLLLDGLEYTYGEIIDNRGKERINKIIKPRTRSMWLRVAKTMERDFYAAPDPSDDLTPWGLQYWIVKNSETGFNGGYPSGFTRIGNIDLDVVTNFKNYTDQYTATTKGDLIKKMKKATRQTSFYAPRTDAGVTGDSMPNKRMYLVNEETIEGVEDIGEAQNENLGNDMAPKTAGTGAMGLRLDKGDNITFKKNPFVYARLLDADSSDPVYGVDMSTIHALTKKGDNMKLSEYYQHPTQRRLFLADLFHRHQTICVNRRNNFVISK
jgi:hypothetical protein